jgi:hypothetical protein
VGSLFSVLKESTSCCFVASAFSGTFCLFVMVEMPSRSLLLPLKIIDLRRNSRQKATPCKSQMTKDLLEFWGDRPKLVF